MLHLYIIKFNWIENNLDKLIVFAVFPFRLQRAILFTTAEFVGNTDHIEAHVTNHVFTRKFGRMVRPSKNIFLLFDFTQWQSGKVRFN